MSSGLRTISSRMTSDWPMTKSGPLKNRWLKRPPSQNFAAFHQSQKSPRLPWKLFISMNNPLPICKRMEMVRSRILTQIFRTPPSTILTPTFSAQGLCPSTISKGKILFRMTQIQIDVWRSQKSKIPNLKMTKIQTLKISKSSKIFLRPNQINCRKC